MFSSLLPAEEMVAENDPNFDGPIIGYCPDWRQVTDPYTGEPKLDPKTGEIKRGYIEFIYEGIKRYVEKSGGKLYTIEYGVPAKDLIGVLDGLIIPGGRDIDPAYYGEKNTHSRFVKLDAKLRWEQCADLLDNSDHKMPIYGICYGYEFVNCYNGGKMIQELHNSCDHYHVREFDIEEGTHLHKAIGSTKLRAACFHHQNVKDVPSNLVVSAYDSEDGSIHGLEYPQDSGRFVMTVLWHPEARSIRCAGAEDEKNRKVMEYFLKNCLEYKKSRDSTSA